MNVGYCPSCKSKISNKARKCPKCGFFIHSKKYSFNLRSKTAGIVAAVIIAVAGYVLYQIYEQNKPLIEQSITVEKTGTHTEIINTKTSNDADGSEQNKPFSEQSVMEVITNTLKDTDGAEYNTNDIILKFNSFMQDEGAGELRIRELVFSSGEAEDTYHDIKNNEDISISMTTLKGLNTVTHVDFAARTGNEKAFFTYCSALMSIFNPTMNADTRDYVLPQVTGYSKTGETPLREDSTFIIVRTKYIFTYSENKGLNMRIQQMPPLLEEDDATNLPPMLRR